MLSASLSPKKSHNKKCTLIAVRAFPNGKSHGSNRVILDVWFPWPLLARKALNPTWTAVFHETNTVSSIFCRIEIAMHRNRLNKTVCFGFCVGLLWLYHLAFPLYRVHDGRVVRKAIWLPPVERLQWLQVPVEHQSRATRLSSDSSSGDYGIVDYRPPPFWINDGTGSRTRMGKRPNRNISLIVAIWGTIFFVFLAGGKLTRTEARMIRKHPGSPGTD